MPATSSTKLLKECGITPSMSRKGNCWDNACSETLFGSLKVERLHGQHFETRRQGKDEALDWLLWYNQTRLHSTLNYVSPMQFEQDSAFSTEASAKLNALATESRLWKSRKAKTAFQLSHSHDDYEVHSVMGYGF